MMYAGIIVAVILCCCLYAGVLSKLYALHGLPDEIHSITAPDTVRLALFRYTPKGDRPHGKPVLLCHGLGANMHNFDVTEHYSLARYMANAGYDVWMLNLRGADVRGVIEYKDWNFDFDDFVRKDIPAAVGHVLERTRANKLSWIGHSMGGMLLYAYLLTGGDRFVEAGATLGSPVQFVHAEKDLAGILKLKGLLKYMSRVHAHVFARLLTPLTGVIDTSFMKSQMNVHNVDPAIIRMAQYNAVTPVSSRLLAQFAGWVEGHTLALSDGFQITENLGRIATPLLVIAGRADRLSRVENTVYAYEHIASPDKAYVELSVKNGFSADYGHIDMVFGRHAPEEVYPIVRTWFDDHLSAP